MTSLLKNDCLFFLFTWRVSSHRVSVSPPFGNFSVAARSMVSLVKIAVPRLYVPILVCAVYPAMHRKSLLTTSCRNIIRVCMSLCWMNVFSICCLLRNVFCWCSALLVCTYNPVFSCYIFMTSASQFPACSLTSSHVRLLCAIFQRTLCLLHSAFSSGEV
jgi:hypothetical protein